MLTTTCDCGKPKNPNAKRCWACGNEARRHTLTGVKHPPERVLANSEGHKGAINRFDLAALTRGQPSPRAVPAGTTRVANGHTQIKCPDGKWRYRARVMWEAAHGPIPHGYLIHHVNEDPHDDRLDNFLMVTRSEHMRIHATPERMRAQQALGVAARKRNGSYGRVAQAS